MTDNTSVSDTEPLPVTCRECSSPGGPMPTPSRYYIKRTWHVQTIYEAHCTTCHVDDKHQACRACKACLPDYHRTDRFLCSSSCRVAWMKMRQQWEVEREIWRTGNPEKAAEADAWVEQIRHMGEVINRMPEVVADERQRQRDIERTQRRRVVCAGGCGRLVQPSRSDWKDGKPPGEPAWCRKCSTDPIRCPECFKDFMPARSDARYCSPACRQAAYRHRMASGNGN